MLWLPSRNMGYPSWSGLSLIIVSRKKKFNSMQFKESQPIYLQIAEFVCEKILLGAWPAGERVPAIRELAVQLGVNPNTVLRTYDVLQQEGVIVNKRGVGIFAADDAIEQATRYRKTRFMEMDQIG